MTEKRYNVWDIDGTIFLEDHKEGSYHIGQVGNVDINCLNDIAKLLNDLTEENEQLKQTVSDWSGSYDELFEDVKRLEEENKELKQRITELEKEVNNLSCGEADWLIEEEL